MKKVYVFVLLVLLIGLQSCFEIIEQVTLKNDGSGSFMLTLNMSKSKTKLNSFTKMKTVNGHKVPTKEEINKKIAEMEKTVAKTAGLSNVKTTVDYDNYIAVLSCNFLKIAQINTVVININEKEKGNNKFVEKSYEYDAATNIFFRLNKISLKEAYKKMSNADKEIFATANYTSIYKFDNNVTSVSNKDAKTSPSKKAVMLSLNALDIITGKKQIENKITLTR